ncbi:MAG: Vacuolar H+transporting two-sector ATPase F subunit [Rhodocyclales bacterium]|nr:Vacuolar H+transporting two-sector ATPase F subunit [Rhodocyclales bacterium]
MKPVLYLGDEVSAAGFRLAGVSVRIVAAGSEAAAFAAARGEAALLLLGAACAARLPPAVLQAALHDGQPPLLVVPERPGDLPPGDPAADVRRLLGLLS